MAVPVLWYLNDVSRKLLPVLLHPHADRYVHGAANIVEIVVFHSPPPMIMQTVLLRVDLLLNFTQ